jgi:hypothetical protein
VKRGKLKTVQSTPKKVAVLAVAIAKYADDCLRDRNWWLSNTLRIGR